jgi:hypothetical protein
VELDVITKFVLIKHSTGDYWKFAISPNADLKKMTVGLVTLNKDEATRLYGVLRDYFTGSPAGPLVEVKDISGLARKHIDSADRLPLAPPSNDGLNEAERLQRENLIDEPTTIQRKPIRVIEDMTLEEKAQV